MKIAILISLLLLFVFENNAWIVLDFPQVKEFYINERANYIGADPFFKKWTRDLKRYCDELRRSAVYGIWTADEPIPSAIVAPRVPAKRYTMEVRYRYQKVNDLGYPVPMFPCLKHANDGYWYLSYGFNPDRLFIFTPATGVNENGRGPVFEIKGLLEKNPRIDTRVQRPSVLEMVFWNSVASNKGILPNLRGRSSQHFRLCSLVFDTLKNHYNPAKGYTINFSPDYDGQSPVTRPVMFQNLMKKRDLSVNAIACAINRSFKRPNFYIIPDTTEPQSVFVLMDKEDLTDGKVKYVVKYYVRDLTILKNWPLRIISRM